MSRLCLIFNTAPRYREAIYTAIDNDYDCDWYFGEKLNDIKEMDYSKLKHVYRYKTIGSRNKLFWQRGMISKLFSKKYQVFFFIAETRCISTWLFIIIAHFIFPKKRLYTWSHGFYGKESKLQTKLETWKYKMLTGAFVYGNYARELMIKNGIPANKLFTIHNSLHYDQQKSLRESITPSNIYKEHFDNEYPTIIFIGRLTKVKKLDMIIEALAKLEAKGENYNLVFVGDGIEKEGLENKTKSLKLKDRVWFYGACYDEKQNAELIYNADLCVSPGNVGLTAIHTLVFGCPVITHNCFKWQMPEFEAIHEGVTGSFFEMDNVEALTDCISKWFANKSAKRDEVRNACFKEIDTQWNPYFQMEVIKKNLKV